MAIELPAWWTEAAQKRTAALKIEDVMIALFTPLMQGVRCVYWLPTDEVTQQVLFEDSEAFLRIYRLDGEVDLDNRRCIHRVQFAGISESRNDSSRIMAFVQWVLYAYEHASYVTMPDGEKVSMRFLRETQGPFLDPQQIRDSRLVPVTVEVETSWPKGLPDPRQHLDM
ncbi:tail terminator [Mycobacterium phage LittleLaf]|uniref:Tail terminator n=13 Tax=Marvinvirus TaxID=1982091 RepID=A0A3S9U957_9CAUD|nr:hypothetical protein FH33_gp042 [Mycobacterium phage MosMoris]YP_009614160.1 hypothetical protein FDI61_gp042 [Mycobacterium phage Marvin]ANM46266.1 hypothetical protein SEA_GATTACA_43 [Mycobacterium phage Gattaca]AVE00789.1 tail terminator [Mycobacterium phage Tesla]AYB69850.1 tail terminator [Mycobacterium phage LittleLaf]AYB70679.1 tail terminator [Mycobacterium phage VasuNzinga]AZF93312.1 tail terminator [Mycobacterium phage Beelzebub]AZS06808.1 tail terminator [Mycobacterium phage Ra